MDLKTLYPEDYKEFEALIEKSYKGQFVGTDRDDLFAIWQDIRHYSTLEEIINEFHGEN